MRIVASVQSKRGSSRGLVHYIAHSKLDPEREPPNSRELFNAFADQLSVKSANNSLKIGVAKGRPTNDELQHLVLSFRDDDYRRLGENEARRRKAVKQIVRAAVKSLEGHANADRLLWTAAMHRNTANPHVHIALQKQYFTKECERQALSRIPREALPHYVRRDAGKSLVLGYLIETAGEKMDTIILRESSRRHAEKIIDRSDAADDRSMSGESMKTKEEIGGRFAFERNVLRDAILAEYEIRRIDSRIDRLLEHGDRMRFTVSDPVRGGKMRVSLREMQPGSADTEPDQRAAPSVQIKAILRKMLAKEDASRIRIQTDSARVLKQADRIRSEYRKTGRKLPPPSLTKEQLDLLQERCLEGVDMRRFSYLERVRNELEKAGEIAPRSKYDLRSIIAEKTIAELRAHAHEKEHAELRAKGYYRRTDVGGDRAVSMAELDRDEKERQASGESFFAKLKYMFVRQSNESPVRTGKRESEEPRHQILAKLGEELANIQRGRKLELCKAKTLEKILKGIPEDRPAEGHYSPLQLAEVEVLSLRLGQRAEYESSWQSQRLLIEAADMACPAYRRLAKSGPTADFGAHKLQTIAGRALAREILAKAEVDKASEDLKIFRDSYRFLKHPVTDPESGAITYLCLHDVDLPQSASLLDRTMHELLEDRERRTLRRAVEFQAKEREKTFKDDLARAKEIAKSATRDASEFKSYSILGLFAEPSHRPIFTSGEIAMLELRIANTRNASEASHLQAVVESASETPLRSLTDLLRDFEGSRPVVAEDKKMEPKVHDDAGLRGRERVPETRSVHDRTPRTFPEHGR
ncbi:MAG: relaxase MobL [Pyrinomonadaceae bacterium]|nr:relaxase MobL [Pyrinomonadaceae bacterium]